LEEKVVLHDRVRINRMGKSYFKIATIRYPVTITQTPDQVLTNLIA
jgi:hypothetical protein